MSHDCDAFYAVALKRKDDGLRSDILAALNGKDADLAMADKRYGELLAKVPVPPSDSQVGLEIWYFIDCATEGCEFDEYRPGGHTEERALKSAFDDFKMGREPDGKLYCSSCRETFAATAKCAAEGHLWGEWRVATLSSGAVEIRNCERFCEVWAERRPVDA